MSPVIKNRGEKFTVSGKFLLMILTILCILLMAVSFGTDVLNRPLNTAVGYVIVPFQSGIGKLGGYLSRRSEELVAIRSLLDENAQLKEQIATLTEQNTLLQQDKFELNHLRELYELDQQYDVYPKIGARIIGRDAGNWYATFLLDKGSEDGLDVDMNVIAGGGLVGRITSVGPNWSKVTSIINDNQFPFIEGLPSNGIYCLLNIFFRIKCRHHNRYYRSHYLAPS